MTLLTARQVATDLGISERTVRDQLAAGVMRGIKPGRDWLVDSSEVDRYRREHLGQPGRRSPGTVGESARKA